MNCWWFRFHCIDHRSCFRPQQGLPIMNILRLTWTLDDHVSVPNRGYLLWIIHIVIFWKHILKMIVSVPNRGYLLWISKRSNYKRIINVSVPNRGYLLWIWHYLKTTLVLELPSFRPQQGLPIMNPMQWINQARILEFPSPTGVTYYE